MEKFNQAAGLFVLTLILAINVGAALFISKFPPPGSFSTLFPAKNPWVREGKFGYGICNGVQCRLCPWNCFLPEGTRGRCRVRINQGGKLKTLVYSKAVSVHLDPMEKKPVYHLYPGSLIYSLAAPGCNLRCKSCQNWEISTIYPEEASAKSIVPVKINLVMDGLTRRIFGSLEHKEVETLAPEDIVNYSLATKSRSIAYTYSEPVVFYEYMLETAKLASEKGLKNVMISAGYINPGPLKELLKYMDIVKIDLKGFNSRFYKEYVSGELEPVKNTLLELKKNNALFEIVNLVAPGLNDDEESMKEMVLWIKKNLGKEVPVFFSRFSPNYQLQNIPATPVETLEKARNIALKEGLQYVYIGNVTGHPAEHTYCPRCKRVLIERYGYAVLKDLLTPNKGRCPYDGAKIPGIW
ncbi:MAG: AmmeMemoRadiSam system radical SAM enzyme [Elusimicrobia bacterium]|nr:AmmeMemoRadiSam system radical SAM enzyme [Elusimicrobiota bacterium]